MKNTPHGVLVSFASHALMDICIERWKEKHLYSKLTDQKTIFVEPRNSKECRKVLDDYLKEAETDKGAAFFGVTRGRVFEGMDFPDKQARAVVIIGIPLPNEKDAVYQAKKQVLLNRGINPADWKWKNAFVGVNQSIGRVMRHKDDFGVVVLCDMRLEKENNRERLPEWVKNAQKGKERGIEVDLKMFFDGFEKKKKKIVVVDSDFPVLS